MSNLYDVVVIADARFPGSTGAVIAAEIAAQAAHGYRTGLLPIRSPFLRFSHRVHPSIAELVRRQACEIVSPEWPVECGLVIVHAPEAFLKPVSRPIRIHSDHRWAIVRDSRCCPGDGSSDQWADIDCHLQQALGGTVEWRFGNSRLAAQLRPSEPAARLEQMLWSPTVDPARWQRGIERQSCDPAVIGTAGGNDRRIWPASREALLGLLPVGPHEVRIAAPPQIFTQWAPFPSGWRISAFHPGQRANFLRDLDIFVRLGREDVVDDALMPILEAMAAGCAVVLPRHWSTQLEPAPLFVELAGAAEAILLFASDLNEWCQRAKACVQVVHDRFGPQQHVERLRIPISRPARNAVSVQRRNERHALFVTSNGIGIGHITRCLAIAKRCPQTVAPVFVTFSQAAPLIRDFGYPAHYIPSQQYLGIDSAAWNLHLEPELRELLRLYDPAVVLFDGNHPHQGLVKALTATPAGWTIWSRRAMWRPGRGKNSLKREANFDLVLEPGELADTADHGLTRERRGRVQRLPPIRLIDSRAMLTREQARDALGVPRDSTCVLVSLGAGNNFDFGRIRSLCFKTLQTQANVSIAYAESPIANTTAELPPGVFRLSVYPLARYLLAFDAAISAAGYNSFHELLEARIPTLFIPNENMQMDDQAARAGFAASCGMALCARQENAYALVRCLSKLFDPSIRASMRRRMENGGVTENGAETAAEIVAELAFTVRTEPLAGASPG